MSWLLWECDAVLSGCCRCSLTMCMSLVCDGLLCACHGVFPGHVSVVGARQCVVCVTGVSSFVVYASCVCIGHVCIAHNTPSHPQHAYCRANPATYTHHIIERCTTHHCTHAMHTRRRHTHDMHTTPLQYPQHAHGTHNTTAIT